MSCIVGIKSGNIIYIGGDSMGTSEISKSTRTDKKIFYVGKRFLIGFTGSFRNGQTLRFYLTVPPQKRVQNNFQFICTTFIESVKECLIAQKLNFKETELLVGYKRVLYSLDSELQVESIKFPFNAIGSGRDFAMDSLHTTEKFNLPPKKRIRMALRAASELSPTVGPPFHILQIPTRIKKE